MTMGRIGTAAVRVVDAFAATVQDLGRTGYEQLGVNRSGASDTFSARAANILVGNAVDAPLLEIADSAFAFETEDEVVVAVTGARAEVTVDGTVRLPRWEAIRIPASRILRIAAPEAGYRTYLAFAGGVQADTLLGSVSPLPARSFDNPVPAGTRLEIGPRRGAPLPRGAGESLAPLAEQLLSRSTIAVMQTAQAAMFADMARLYTEPFTMSPRSNAVGARFDGATPVRVDDTEITSRSVPIGSVEIPSSGELIALLRGRLITAGYPIPAVIARADLDAVAQLRPGAVVRFAPIDEDAARWRVFHQESALRRLLELRENA